MESLGTAAAMTTEPEFRLLVDTANVAILSIDEAERIVYCNFAAGELFGYENGELRGQSFHTLLAERVQEVSTRGIAAIRQSGTARSKHDMVLVGIKRDGSEFTAESSVNPWSRGHAQGVHVILRDVTQLLETEQTMRELLTEKDAAHEESETLRAASVLLSQNLKFKAVLDAILDCLQRLVPYDCASIMTIDDDTRLIVQSQNMAAGEVPARSRQEKETFLEIRSYPLLQQVVRERESLVVADTDKHPSSSALCGLQNTRSWVGIPLIATDRVIGICSMEKETSDFFTPRHVHRAESLMRQAGIAIQNSRLFDQVEKYSVELERKLEEYGQAQRLLAETNSKLSSSLAELERRNFEVSRLSEFTDMLQACQAPEEVYRVLEAFGPRIFANQEGALFMINAAKLAVENVAGWGTSEVAEPVFAPDACWALRRSRSHVTDEGDTKLRCPHLLKAPPTGALCVPVMAHGEALGLLTLSQVVASKACVNTPKLSEAEIRVATAMTEQIALSLANLKLRETLRTQSIRDPLTGLYNRRHMEDTVARELIRLKRKQLPMGVMMIDIDHFKKFNDTQGHEAGDLLLRHLAQTLQANVRGEDIVCRYGGEEFTIIMPEAPLEIIQARAELLCQAVRGLNPEYHGHSLGGVSISVGVSVLPQHGHTTEALLRVADIALYRAKSDGRDRVVVGALPTKG